MILRFLKSILLVGVEKVPDALVSGHVEQTRHDLEGRDEEPSVQPPNSLRPNYLPASVPGSAVPAIKARPRLNEHVYCVGTRLFW